MKVQLSRAVWSDPIDPCIQEQLYRPGPRPPRMNKTDIALAAPTSAQRETGSKMSTQTLRGECHQSARCLWDRHPCFKSRSLFKSESQGSGLD